MCLLFYEQTDKKTDKQTNLNGLLGQPNSKDEKAEFWKS